MGIWITGDIHSNIHRFSTDVFYEQKEFSGNKDENVIIVCGDFGIIWNCIETKEEEWKLNWLEDKPFTTVFVCGNHDNHPRIAMYPVKEWNGGLVHEIRPHVLHLTRGEVYTIQGKKFFAFGGAASHDIQDGILDPNDFDDYEEFRKTWKQWDKEYRMFRVKGITWWDTELPNQDEMNDGIANLEDHDWTVDYIITHSPPASVIALLGHGLYKQDILTQYLEEVRQNTEYGRWFMGHMHINKAINDKDILLYEQIVRIV